MNFCNEKKQLRSELFTYFWLQSPKKKKKKKKKKNDSNICFEELTKKKKKKNSKRVIPNIEALAFCNDQITVVRAFTRNFGGLDERHRSV